MGGFELKTKRIRVNARIIGRTSGEESEEDKDRGETGSEEEDGDKDSTIIENKGGGKTEKKDMEAMMGMLKKAENRKMDAMIVKKTLKKINEKLEDIRKEVREISKGMN